MDAQLPRRRASGNVRDQASAYRSAPQVNTQPTPLGIQDEAVKNEEHAWNGASTLRVAKEQRQQKNTSRPCEQRSSKVFEAGIAIILSALLLLSLLKTQTRFIFNADSAGSLKLKAGIHIPLHPEEHIHRPPTEIELRWSVTTGFRAPDGVKKRVYLINGKVVLDCFQAPVQCIHNAYLSRHLKRALSCTPPNRGTVIHTHSTTPNAMALITVIGARNDI